jgi:hypothetical protein
LIPPTQYNRGETHYLHDRHCPGPLAAAAHHTLPYCTSRLGRISEEVVYSGESILSSPRVMPTQNGNIVLDSRPIASARSLEANPAQFARDFNVKSFLFRHSLGGNPLFKLPRLQVLAERMLERGALQKFVALGGQATGGMKFADMRPQAKLADTVGRLEDGGSWLKLSSVNVIDSEYDNLLHALLRDIEELSGAPLRQHITWASMTIFMASRGIVTPYHIDHESNFLLQISGRKQITLFDPADRVLLTEDEIERFYRGDIEAAQYRPELQSRGSVYELEPGAAVHHPPLAPHWVKNGDNVSISVSVGFCLRSLDLRARVYQVNHLLRRFGLRPTPPGQSGLRDRMKIAGVGLLSDSSPTSREEMLFSGFSRLTAPARFLKRAAASIRRV